MESIFRWLLKFKDIHNMSNGIGELNEKSMHSITKDYISSDKSTHEVKVGNYIADIKIDNHIYEVQTRCFKNLVNKLKYYIKNGYEVTVVYPLAVKGTLFWLNDDDTIAETRNNNYVGVIQDIFRELYWIKDFIANEEIEFRIVAYKINDYRYLDGYGSQGKIRATKIDRVPTEVLYEISFKSVSDLKQFLPDALPEEFTSFDFKRCSHTKSKYFRSGLKMLRELGVIYVVRKEGNTLVYKINSVY